MKPLFCSIAVLDLKIVRWEPASLDSGAVGPDRRSAHLVEPERHFAEAPGGIEGSLVGKMV